MATAALTQVWGPVGLPGPLAHEAGPGGDAVNFTGHRED